MGNYMVKFEGFEAIVKEVAAAGKGNFVFAVSANGAEATLSLAEKPEVIKPVAAQICTIDENEEALPDVPDIRVELKDTLEKAVSRLLESGTELYANFTEDHFSLMNDQEESVEIPVVQDLTYALAVSSEEILAAVQKVIPAGGKDVPYMISIIAGKTAEGKLKCTLTTATDAIQAASGFEAQVAVGKMEEDRFTPLGKEVEDVVSMIVSPMFVEAVQAMAALEDVMFLTLNRNGVLIKNTATEVPVSVKESMKLLTGKTGKSVSVSVGRAELLSALKYAGLAPVPDKNKPATYGIKLVEDKGLFLRFIGACSTALVVADVAVKSTSGDKDLKVPAVFLDAAKIDSIINANESEKVKFTFRTKEKSEDISQVELEMGRSFYKLLPYVGINTEGIVPELFRCYEEREYGFCVEMKKLRGALPIFTLSEGKETIQMVEIHVCKNSILICEPGKANKRSGRNVVIKDGVETKVSGDEEVFTLNLAQLNKNIKPYGEKVSIYVSGKLFAILEGDDERIAHGITRCKNYGN